MVLLTMLDFGDRVILKYGYATNSEIFDIFCLLLPDRICPGLDGLDRIMDSHGF